MSDNAIIMTRGYGANGGTETRRLDLGSDTWNALGARPDPAGTTPTGGAVGCCDRDYFYAVLKDGKLYRMPIDTGVWDAVALAGGEVVLPSVTMPYGMICDGRIVYIPYGDKSMRRYDITADAMLSAIGIPPGAVGVTVDNMAITWDHEDGEYLYVNFRDTGGTIQFVRYSTLTNTWSSALATVAGNTVARGLTFLSGKVYLTNPIGSLWKYDPVADNWGGAAIKTGLPAGPCFAVNETDIIVIGFNAASPDVVRYNVVSTGTSILPDMPVGNGSWAAGAYTMPFTDPFEHTDSLGNAIVGNLPSLGTARIGGVEVSGPYYVKALANVTHCYVKAVAMPNTDFKVATAAIGPWLSQVDLGAMTTGQVKTYYVKAQALSGLPRTDALNIVVQES